METIMTDKNTLDKIKERSHIIKIQLVNLTILKLLKMKQRKKKTLKNEQNPGSCETTSTNLIYKQMKSPKKEKKKI